MELGGHCEKRQLRRGRECITNDDDAGAAEGEEKEENEAAAAVQLLSHLPQAVVREGRMMRT